MLLNKHISRGQQIQKYWSYEADFSFKTLEISCRFQKCKKKPQKIYGFSDNLIEVGNGKFSLLIREYSKLAVNALSSSLKISDAIKNNFL